jgi:predicted dehydrogenase
MGKHVYVEKPISHCPAEGELLIKAARKYNRIVQMGNQRRSGTGNKQMIADLRSGIIGNVYMAKTWYLNGRGPSYFKAGTVPSWLDYGLWQGPAPHRPYMEGLVHYDWHWLWHWGTGEALNNGTHEVDVARWGLGVEFPTRVSSTGGIFVFKDDWETPDTQIISLEFPDNKMIVWESHSRNSSKLSGSDRGVIFYGDKGSLRTIWGDGYTVYDRAEKVVKELKDPDTSVPNTVSSGIILEQLHIKNFLDSIRNGQPLNSECEIGHRSTLLMQLGNIAWRMKQTLVVDPGNGHILTPGAEKYWSREYEKGWEPVV